MAFNPKGYGRNGSRFHRGEREMFDAVCADCGQPCQVPFKPIEGRPVYCQECYRKRRARRY